MENFSNRRNTRSQTVNENYSPENKRCDIDSDSHVSLVEPDLSSISGVSVDSYTSHIQPDTSSASLSIVDTTLSPEILPEVVVELPSLSNNVIPDKAPESNSHQSMKVPIMDLDDSNAILHEHLSKHPETKITDISCSYCPVNIKSIGVAIGYLSLIYCERCNLYICGKCIFGTTDTIEGDEPFTHSSTCDYPSNFIT